ncbi:MAG: NADPH:quinone oxidoreductase family protein [Rhodospirillaceae bacterium]|nr:NADPH:quinone oxidoreductase family protein [Rhodospirillaceae bacterium]
MKALLSHQPGGPETLRLTDVPDPAPRAGEIVIGVKACGVNYPDVLIIEDRYQMKPPRPFSPGGEVAGVVAAVGSDVKNFAVGDAVLGLSSHGGMAEKMVVKAATAGKIPADTPFAEAAVLLTTYGTSYYALKDRGQLKPKERLLVLGASGGVGIAAVELGKAMGATVIGAVSSPEKAEAVRKAGADHVVVYPTGDLSADQQRDLTKAFRDAMGGENADVVYDPVGGAYSEAALRATNWGGRFLVVGFVAGIPRIPLNLPLLKGCSIVGVLLGGHVGRDPKGYQRNAAEIFAMYQAGTIKPLISARYPLERGAEAIASLRDRKAVGKVVVTVGE